VPFLIDWGDAPHPTSRGLPEARLLEVTARHPDPDSVAAALNALGVDLEVRKGELAALTAIVQGRGGAVPL
jgi:hypothetical protein